MTAQSTPSCPERVNDAAFVLGALPAPDRDAYAVHLRTCAVCRQSVAELEGMPSLLDRVPLDVALPLADTGEGGTARSGPGGALSEPPADLLEGLLSRVRRDARRRWWARGGIGALAAAAVAALVFVLWPGSAPEPAPRPAAASQTVELKGAGDSPMQVRADLTTVAWGTRIELTCTYASAGRVDYEPTTSYALVLLDSAGNDEQVGTWGAVPGRTVHVGAATSMELDNIASLEVRGPDGTPLLRAER